jgi:hypothetical protein
MNATTLPPHEHSLTACASWYELDAENRVRAVSDDWDRFAASNDGSGARAGRVVGRPLARFIEGDGPRMLMEAALQAARLTRQPRTLSYRCDAPALERHLRMVLTPLADGGVRVEHRVERLLDRPEAARCRTIAGPAAPAPAGPAPRWRCARCLHLAPGPQGPWQAQGPRAPDAADAIPVRYTLCSPCREDASRQLGLSIGG